MLFESLLTAVPSSLTSLTEQEHGMTIIAIHRDFVSLDLRSKVRDPSVVEKILEKIDETLSTVLELTKNGLLHTVPEAARQSFTVASIIKGCLLLWLNPLATGEVLQILDIASFVGVPVKDWDLLEPLSVAVDYISKTNSTVSYNVCRFVDLNENFALEKTELPILDEPSIETFIVDHFKTSQPVKLTKGMMTWAALSLWNDANYWKRIAGQRTVPVEMGDYAEKHTLRIVTLADYLDQLLSGESAEKCGYLAQFQLLDMEPRLLDDIAVPDYCAVSNEENPTINLWLGPAGTTSSLHYDPYPNFLCQVFGVKQVILFAPSDSPYLYARTDRLMHTSQVDCLNPNLEKFPFFVNAKPIRCTLRPGEMLFIPAGFWHHVQSKTISCSVNFFF